MYRVHGPLCAACEILPWGEKGWQNFHQNTRKPSADQDTYLGKAILYEVSAADFFDQARHCVWCLLLRDNLKTVSGKQCISVLETKLEQYERLDIVIEFGYAVHATPRRITILYVSCRGRRKAGLDHDPDEYGVELGCVGSADPSIDHPFLSLSRQSKHPLNFDAVLVRSWMRSPNECFTSPLPTRLLEVPSPNEPQIVRLVENQNSQKGQYACLSYTWGPDPARELQPRFATLGELALSHGIEFDALPGSMRDAVKVVQALGLQHLWIDGLCIKQDDNNDKFRELARMHDYYSKSSLVIQCSGTTSVDDGFLGDSRTPLILRNFEGASSPSVKILSGIPPELGFSFFTSSLSGFEALQAPTRLNSDEIFLQLPYIDENGKRSHFWICRSNIKTCTWYHYDREPATERGWILQEQILGSSTLVFPSTGGLLFQSKTNPGEADRRDLNDGNVVFYPTDHQPPKLPDARVLTQDEIVRYGLNRFDAEDLEKIAELKLLWQRGRLGSFLRVTPSKKEVVEVASQVDRHRSGLKPAMPENEYHVIPRMLEQKPTTTCPYTVDVNRKGFSQIVHTKSPSGFISPVELCLIWTSLVSDYCERDLTNPLDKLPAIAAVARAFHAQYSVSQHCLGEYRCGLWDNFIVSGLLWQVHKPRARQTITSPKFKIPSWSWASVEKSYYERLVAHTDEGWSFEGSNGPFRVTPQIQIIETVTVPVSSGLAFETVVDAYIVVKGLLLDCDWYVSKYQHRRTLPWETPMAFSLWNISDRLPDRCDGFVDHLDEVPEGRAAVKLLILTFGRGGELGWFAQVAGLVLKEIGDQTYRRVGRFAMLRRLGQDRGNYNPDICRGMSQDFTRHRIRLC